MTADERPMLEGMLRWHRSTLLQRCAGLTGEQLAEASVPPSNLSLLGLIRHLAKVERTWFRQRVTGDLVAALYDPARTDVDFEELDPAGAEQDYAQLLEECRLADTAVADLGLDHTFDHGGQTYSLRLVYLHMIGEYARHNGHADLIRERVDGVTGA